MEIIKENDLLINPNQLVFLAQEITDGRIAAIKTDTLYGLITNPFMESSYRKVFTLKSRDYDKKLILLTADINHFSRFGSNINSPMLDIIKEAASLSTTFIIRASAETPSCLTANGTIAMRLLTEGILYEILQYIDFPVTGTSANIADAPVCRGPCEITKVFGDSLDYVVHSGFIQHSIPSTLIDISGEEAKVLRQGKNDIDIRKIINIMKGR